jgi:hypothetical protein
MLDGGREEHVAPQRQRDKGPQGPFLFDQIGALVTSWRNSHS